jgi:hypothetical protein
VGLVGIGVAQSLTPLTDEALRRARQWQAYGRHLKHVSKDGGLSHVTPLAFEHALPYAAAFGVALAWATALQKRGVTAGPAWLHALAREGAATTGNMPAMVALLSAAQSHADAVNHAATGVSSGGAAGGGSSSAG